MATRKKLEIDGMPVSVQSAIEDGAGKNIQNNYAKQDGYYQGLTAGLSDNLNSRMTLKDNSPYLFRTAGGSLEVGNKCYLKHITGVTVVFNQLVNTDMTEITLKKHHKYLTFISGNNTIVNGTNNSISVTGGTDCVIDLTIMLGSFIADYIYNLETSSAGAGVAWFKRVFPNDYYAYDAGSLLSVKTTGKKVIGFNAYNHTTGSAKLLGGYEYQASGTFTSLAYQDVGGNTGTFTLDADGKFTPDNDCTVLVVDGNSTDTCVHLVWDGERDGEFAEYQETTYPIENIELRGVPKLDGSNNLYYDGDEYKNNGTVKRRYGIRDLGTISWSKGTNRYNATGVISNMKTVSNGDTMPNFVCMKYEVSSYNSVFSGNGRISIHNSNNLLYISDNSGMTEAEFKASLSGVYLVYELATPTTETVDEFTETQLIDNWGTEKFMDDRTIPLPVGHNIEYLPDLKAKLEIISESPESDGYYIMKRDNGENSYSLLNSWLSANYYVKKEEIALTNVGTITATEIVSGSLYRNDIAVSGGVDAEDVIFIETSDSVVYPTLNTNGTTLTVFCATNLSSISVSKIWKL